MTLALKGRWMAESAPPRSRKRSSRSVDRDFGSLPLSAQLDLIGKLAAEHPGLAIRLIARRALWCAVALGGTIGTLYAASNIIQYLLSR